jgi:hypothetical protein
MGRARESLSVRSRAGSRLAAQTRLIFQPVATWWRQSPTRFRRDLRGLKIPVYRQYVRLERVKGIEPSYSAWKAAALPLSYTREFNVLGGFKKRGTPSFSPLPIGRQAQI